MGGDFCILSWEKIVLRVHKLEKRDQIYMSTSKMMRLSLVAKKLNVGISTIAQHLASKGHDVDGKPNTRITPEQYHILAKEFESSIAARQEASNLNISKKSENIIIADTEKPSEHSEDDTRIFIKDNTHQSDKSESESDSDHSNTTDNTDDSVIKAKGELKGGGLKVIGKIDLEEADKEKEPSSRRRRNRRRSRKRKEENTSQENPENSSVENQQITPKSEPIVTQTPAVVTKPVVPEEVETQVIEAKAEKLQGLKVLGKIELPTESKKKKPTQGNPKDDASANNKRRRKRKRIRKPAEGAAGTNQSQTPNQQGRNKDPKEANTNRPTNTSGNTSNNTTTSGGNTQNSNSGNTQNTNRSRSNHGSNANPRVQDNRNQPDNRKNRRRRKIDKPADNQQVSDKEIQEKIKDTLARLSGGGKAGTGKAARRQKKDKRLERERRAAEQQQEDAKKLRVTEFISANDLAVLMEVSVNEVISKCMSLGMFVSINQRLDAEAITFIADEFDYEIEFASAEDEIDVNLEVEDKTEDLQARAPIVTIMGHVDHGKTSLLDYIRDSKITEGEAGGITQHIGAYSVKAEKSGKYITFLDTPGHEAFTAMRARGAKVTDVVIVVIAADDNVMPQTREAINHAQVAGVPIVFALNKVDKPEANPNKIKEELSQMNILVEDWGGKYQCQEISAKTGQGIDDLLEAVLLEAEVLELQANPDKPATGTVIEAFLDKGKGYVSTILIQGGTLNVGDTILAGAHHGRVKAMSNHLGKKLNDAGPATPVQVLGLNGAPQAGDKFNVLLSEREARDIATKRGQILREQGIRATVRTTLTDLGRRIALGNFQQLNIILKGDVDGSVEALSDSLLKLSTPEVEVNIIQKAVGQISESDVLLATASDAIIIGFQVRPSASARKLAEQESVEIRLYSVIYNAIDEVTAAMEGMLAPTIKEQITGTAEVRDTFKISKVGMVAGCYVTEGFIKRSSKVRLIRDGIVVYGGENGGELLALKRFKEDVAEVKNGYECGMSVRNFNDIKVGDVIEAYEEKEIKRTL